MEEKGSQMINLGIFAHVDAGKTTLTEQLLTVCGKLRQAGSVDSGTAQTDFLPIERERGISVAAAATNLTWKNHSINILDTPGHVDFAGEAERAMIALDAAILVVSAVEGVQSHTENLWRAFTEMHIPCIVFINKIDRVGSSVSRVLEELADMESCTPCPLNRPLSEGDRNCSVAPVGEELTERLADYDDTVAEAYLSGTPIAAETLYATLRHLTGNRTLTPVLCGSSLVTVGIAELLDATVALLPHADCRETEALSGLVFKIEHDKAMGKIAHVRLFGGEIRNRDAVVLNEDKDADGNSLPPEKVTQIRKFNGSRYMDIGSVRAGDIAALCGLDRARAFDTIGEYRLSDVYRLANPYLTVRIAPKNAADLTRLVAAVKELSDEDPLINYKWERTEREIHVNITGEIQREILEVLLKERYGLETVFSDPSVIYKETPATSGIGFEAYTMPKPCWAVVKLGIEPLPRGSGIVYDGGNVPHNKLFYKYQSHIRASFHSSLEQGNYGWELTDMKVTLLDGEHHTIHTHPLDFFVATPMAIMDGINRTGTTLLEPMLRVKIIASEELLGKLLSDITVMRGEFDGPTLHRGSCTVLCRLPVATSLDFPVRLAAMSGGKAIYSATFDGYRECPLELGATAKRRGVNPLDRAKWILYARGAIQADRDGNVRA
ncbi:MAG: TetM/TetW/TetO/TetS family tetracycline resistance ribosomal protection protein [Clostridia bacterium]|nr:TetM/TetW/TetO/TetS family tetracycline resistance ribosomal protection protein [Clostridia bacterium]